MVQNFRVKLECAVCPTRIWDSTGTHLKKTGEYNEVDVRLSDGTLMTTGVCSEHVALKGGDLLKMTEKMRKGWLEEVALNIGDGGWVHGKGVKLVVEAVA